MKLLSYLGRGIIHERQGVLCQDAVGFAVHENGNMVAVLSDGAGGARYAREAAQTNVDAVLEYFRRHPASEFREMELKTAAQEIIDVCQLRLRQLAGKLGGCRRSDLCATVLFALWDGKMLTLGHLGDGMILVVDSAAKQRLYSQPENPAENRRGTWFTVSVDAVEHLRLCHLEEGAAEGFLMTSDGACEMLQNRAGGQAESAAMLLELVRTGRINTNEELEKCLNDISSNPMERLDDWSLLIICPDMHGEHHILSSVKSMLDQMNR